MNNTTSLTKMHHEMIKLRERAEKAEGELAKAQAELQKLLAVSAPSVPEEFLVVVERICRMAGEYETAAQARALLQSFNKSAEGCSSQAHNTQAQNGGGE